MEMKPLRLKKGQVWIETVIYTLIGITIIGILLAVSKPKIDSMKDKLVIEQTIDSLNKIGDRITEMQSSPGNVRIIELKINKGKLTINSENSQLLWVLDSSYQYSELDREITIGNQKVITSGGNPYVVKLWSSYPNLKLTFNGAVIVKDINSAPSPYLLRLENKGISDGKTNIDFSLG